MSVLKTKRIDSPLRVLTEAKRLTVYTMVICNNEKRFPKRWRWATAGKIADKITSMMSLISEANAIMVNDAVTYEERRIRQVRALAYLEGAISLMDVSYILFSGLKHISTDNKPEKMININNWANQAGIVKALLLKWKKSDRERYEKKFKE